MEKFPTSRSSTDHLNVRPATYSTIGMLMKLEKNTTDYEDAIKAIYRLIRLLGSWPDHLEAHPTIQKLIWPTKVQLTHLSTGISNHSVAQLTILWLNWLSTSSTDQL
jgi:hypothetical protein